MSSNTLELNEEGAVKIAPAMPDPMIGRDLLHYRVIERIGQGGMSVVYRGRDQHLGRDVAIKVLHPFLAEKPECRARLAREARAVARLEHDSILRIYDYSGDPTTLDETPGAASIRRARDTHEGFLVTELVPGDTLKHFSEDHTLWDVPEVGALVVWQLACALAHAHAQGVVHRDLKPENVMVRIDGALKLMDFGIAQIVDGKSLTITGTLLGSPAHMAPECIEGIPADPRSDIFSLGTVLYWLTTGHLPFDALTPHALLRDIVEGRFAPPQKRQPRVSDELAKVIMRAMENRADNRYQTAGELAEALEETLAECGIIASADEVARVLANPEARMAEIAATVRRTALERATRMLDDGATARALSVLSRVLAQFPGDDEATALLERATDLGIEEDEESEAPSVEAEEEATTSPPMVATEHIDSLVPGPARAPSSSVRRGAFVAAAVIGLGAVVVLVARVDDMVGGDASSSTSPDPAVAADAEAMSVGVPSVDLRPGEAPDGMRLTEASKLLARPKAAQLRPRRADKVRPTITAATPPQTPESANAPTRAVVVRVNAPAQLVVDGAEPTGYAKRFTPALSVGRHRLEIVHPLAVPARQVVEVDVPVEGDIPDVVVKLAPAPAELVVRANVDADIAVRPLEGDGRDKIVGTTRGSERRPIPVFFDRLAGRMDYEVTITQAGFRPHTTRVTLRAGKTTELKGVVLQPATDASPP